VDFLAQPAFRTDAHAIAHRQHADHQLGIDRGAAGAAVERLQRCADAFEIEVLVDSAQLMISGNVIIKAEIVEQPSRSSLHAHHRRFSRKSAGEVNHAASIAATPQFFNSIGAQPPFPAPPAIARNPPLSAVAQGRDPSICSGSALTG